MIKILPSETKQLILTKDNDVLTITLNNPQYKNALSEYLTPYLRKILKKLKKENIYKILVIRGKGNCFCSGGNIKKMNINKTNIKIKNTEKINDNYVKQLELTTQYPL